MVIMVVVDISWSVLKGKGSSRLFLHTRTRLTASTAALFQVCDMYRADFGDEPMEAVKICIQFLDRVKWERVATMLAGVKAPLVKYIPIKLKSHENLCFIEDR
jgi:hypothetical protein